AAVRREIGLGRAAALALQLGHLVEETAELVGAVAIGDTRQPVLHASGEEGIAQARLVAELLYIQRPGGTVVVAFAELLVVLGTLEAGQHVGIAPAGIAERGPVVVVAAVAAHIEHRVDRAAAAQRLAARLV